MGTFPMDVLATTSADPLKPTCTSSVSVTAAKRLANAVLSRDFRGTLDQLTCKSAIFPVDTPPIAGVLGISSLGDD